MVYVVSLNDVIFKNKCVILCYNRISLLCEFMVVLLVYRVKCMLRLLCSIASLYVPKEHVGIWCNSYDV